ncbi:VOC family protein [Deinococcus sedimenti]|uniref:VOC family protein n=1 Tax=Deinococcus sedimenti TaxID=1867090 RepID=A0ABQ2S7P9_9DEIO|nr:VOC family protein [Deinococcus sedimenti]GGR96585.1 VOC family protein [Deinococcus sedimenti]
MPSTLTVQPYLGFSGQARDALTFYQSCLGGAVELMTVADSPVAAHFPPDAQEHVLHGTLTSGPLILNASDMREDTTRTHSVSLALQCVDAAQARKVFDALAQGGTVTQPLGPSFWGGQFGELTDRFGLHWLLNVPAEVR